jgi:ABC-2 type transport system ATP-binding protein
VLLQDALLELKRNGNAVLFSTHRMDQVEKLCDSICLINRGEAVLAGGMREVKSRYPRNRVIVQYEGDDGFLRHPAIAEYKSYAGHAEIELKPQANAQDLLKAAAATATITKFELVEPSLEEIFIETVGGRADA